MAKRCIVEQLYLLIGIWEHTNDTCFVEITARTGRNPNLLDINDIWQIWFLCSKISQFFVK